MFAERGRPPHGSVVDLLQVYYECASDIKMKFTILFMIASASLVRGQSCNPPGGGAGRCVSILKCPPMEALASKPSRTQEEINLLRASACGFEGQTPKVCCPEPCTTPDGAEGNCVDIYQCPHLADLLKPPVSRDVQQFLQKSKCNGPTQYSVCCGPATQPQPDVKVEVGNCETRVFAFPPDPRTQCCGFDAKSGDRIIGGEAAGIDEYPWLVIIEYVKDNKIKLLCGGTLISSRYVLTAGHCLAGPVLDAGTPKNVRIGEYDTSNNEADCVPSYGGGEDCNEPVLIVPIERTIPHPEYDVLAKKNDIGLIRMSQNAPYTDFIRPICLPDTDVTASASAVNFTAAGWGAVSETVGKSNIKLYVQLPFVTKQQCQAVYTAPRRRTNLWEKQLCAGGEKDRDSCKGDSGGPLMYSYKDHGRQDIVGVVSFGPKPCGVENIPGVYTKVFAYKSWINSVIQL